jgi:hypothetical protein
MFARSCRQTSKGLEGAFNLAKIIFCDEASTQSLLRCLAVPFHVLLRAAEPAHEEQREPFLDPRIDTAAGRLTVDGGERRLVPLHDLVKPNRER